MSPESSPKSSVHSIIPEARIREICGSHGVGEGGQAIIEQILVRWEGTLLDPEKKLQIFVEEAGDYQNRLALLESLLQINLEFIDRNPMHPLGGFAKKAPDN